MPKDFSQHNSINLANRRRQSVWKKYLHLLLNNITFYKHHAHLINLKTVSIRIFHSTESMLSPRIVHAFPYAVFIPPCSSIVIIVFHENLGLFFFFWHIIICTHVRKSRRLKMQKKISSDALGIFSIEWTQVDEKKKCMKQGKKIGGLIFSPRERSSQAPRTSQRFFLFDATSHPDFF